MFVVLDKLDSRKELKLIELNIGGFGHNFVPLEFMSRSLQKAR